MQRYCTDLRWSFYATGILLRLLVQYKHEAWIQLACSGLAIPEDERSTPQAVPKEDQSWGLLFANYQASLPGIGTGMVLWIDSLYCQRKARGTWVRPSSCDIWTQTNGGSGSPADECFVALRASWLVSWGKRPPPPVHFFNCSLAHVSQDECESNTWKHSKTKKKLLLTLGRKLADTERKTTWVQSKRQLTGTRTAIKTLQQQTF